MCYQDDMILFFALVYLALLLAIVFLLGSSLVGFLRRPAWHTALPVLGLVVYLLLVALLWRLAGQPRPVCVPLAGLQHYTQADARAQGYLLTPGSTAYFRHAVYDLVQGRIRFFETAQGDGLLLRYQLLDRQDPRCIARSQVDDHLQDIPMPRSQCVGGSPVTAPASRYAVEGYADSKGQITHRVLVRDRADNKMLAEYRWPWSPAWSRLWATASHCMQAAAQAQDHPYWNLTGFVFPDHAGNTLDASSLARIRAAQTQGLVVDVLPPTLWVRRELLVRDQLDTRRCWLPGWMGPTEVHVIELERGPTDVTARLDTSTRKAGFAIVDVNVPDTSVVLLLRAREPTVWHIHESSNTSLVAVLARGEHGQAVLGLTPYTRVLLSTQWHNPYTNCSLQELETIEADVIRRYGVTQRLGPRDGEGPNQVRFTVGLPDGGQPFHYIERLEDFEISAE